jgi:hypothetical protein
MSGDDPSILIQSSKFCSEFVRHVWRFRRVDVQRCSRILVIAREFRFFVDVVGWTACLDANADNVVWAHGDGCPNRVHEDWRRLGCSNHTPRAMFHPVGGGRELEYRLSPGERYGWWVDHEPEKDMRQVAMVHGAVNDVRVKILLDTGASVSMISLDLARRLKVNLNRHKLIKVSGLGGIPTCITASTQVKVTLGFRVVYVVDVWVANIGEGVDVLLGMNFMYSAGVRLCIREGLVQLPDEETVVLYDADIQKRPGLDLPVQPRESMYLMPGDQTVVRIQYGQSNPQREVVWAGRGDRWVTQILYGAESWPVAVKVVNVSAQKLWIDSRTVLARIIEYGSFPQAGGFVRAGTRAYQEWEALVWESARLRQRRLLAERLARSQLSSSRQAQEPPCVERPDYTWPTKLMVRPSPGTAEVRMVQLQVMHPSPIAAKLVMLDEGTQTDIGLDGSLEGMVFELSVMYGSTAEGGSVVDSTDATHSEEMASEVDSDGDEFYDAVLLDDYGVALDAVPEGDDDDDVSDLPSGDMPCTPPRRLEMEYARCMKVNADELDLEPAVYINEGSELLSQLRDQLAMLPELRDLSPECDIDTADVGVPDVSTLDKIES